MDQFVGPYRILRLIDSGGQGKVYLGYDRRLRRRVAIKIHTLPDERSNRRRLLREARLVASLQHPRIVAVHDVIESSQHLAMVMEYVPGCSLEELLRARRLSLASVLTIGIDVASALATARQHKLVHGDLKPGNILIGTDGHAKLTDFGIGRDTAPGRTALRAPRNWQGGTVAALSPEQYRGGPVGIQTDLFALGILLYRMLSGEHPFLRDGALDSGLLLRGTPQPVAELLDGSAEVPEVLLAAIDLLLAKEPEQRPRNTRGVRQAMRAAFRGIPVAAHRSLLREARPCFRTESPEDIPLPVPESLGRRARSRLPPTGGRLARFVYWLQGLSRPVQAAAALSTALLLGTLAYSALQLRVTTVQFEPPRLSLGRTPRLTPDVNIEWLVAEVKHVTEHQLGRLQVIGRLGAPPDRVIVAPARLRPPPPLPEQVISTTLHCFERVCLIDIQRRADGRRFRGQAMVFPEATPAQWRHQVRRAARALFE